jgi:fatty-acyl-CoA synthase
MNVGDWIKKRSILSPENIAMIYVDRERETQFTYRTLNDHANQAANYLLAKGVKKGDRVAALLFNCNQFLEVYFACAKLGVIFVPLNWRLASQELEYQLCDSGSRFLVVHDAFKDKIDPIRLKIPVREENFCVVESEGVSWGSSYEDTLLAFSTTEPETKEEVVWKDPQMIMYTSGVAGIPKGVLMSHKKTLFNTLNADIYYDSLRPEDRLFSPLPLFHSGGLLMIATPILYRGGIYITTRTFDPGQCLKLIEKYRVTIFVAMATMMNMILHSAKVEDYDLNSLRYVLSGGEKTPLSLFEKLSEKGIYFTQAFGQTENSSILVLPYRDAFRKRGSVGLPVFHCQVKLIDEQGHEVPRGSVGEIVVKGPTVMMGYWNNPEETRKTIVNGWLHTGDLGKTDEEGYFYIVDRKKDMYRSGGENVYPAEIEKILYNHPKILEAAILAVPDDKWGETGKAFIVLKSGETMTKEEVIQFLHGKVAKYKFPTHVAFVKDLPHTESGKIKKGSIKEGQK